MAFHRLATVAVAAGMLAAGFSQTAFAQSTDLAPATGNWMVRLRAVNLTAANKSDAVPALAIPADAPDGRANSSTCGRLKIPHPDALELILARSGRTLLCSPRYRKRGCWSERLEAASANNDSHAGRCW